mmetsp:Transcript_12014/g.24392  ORF Transcript_12014/g.24392 Transcript_12014/m.24392 type:complete len:111 (+) Transcript_12014:149-481(+)
MKFSRAGLAALSLFGSTQAFSPGYAIRAVIRSQLAVNRPSSSPFAGGVAFRPFSTSLFAASANADSAASSTFQSFPSIDVTSTSSTAPFSLNSILPLDTPTVVIFLRHMG